MHHKTVVGVGVFDSADAAKGNPYYAVWQAMLIRCYTAKYPSYLGCTVVREWHSYSTFKEWMLTQNWEGMQLDKDLLVIGNMVYGPDTCLFVTGEVNKLFNTQHERRGLYPLGVTWCGPSGQYRATIRKGGKKAHLGLFTSERAAAEAYVKAKAQHVLNLAVKQVCEKTRKALMGRAKLMMGGT